MDNNSWQKEYFTTFVISEHIPEHLRANLVDRGFNFEANRPEDLAREYASVGFTLFQIQELTGLRYDQVATAIARVPGWLPKALDLHVQGLTALEISRELGVSRSGLYYHFHKRRIQPNTDVPASITTRQQKAILRAYGKGDNAAEIARRMGLSYDQVRYAIHQGTS